MRILSGAQVASLVGVADLIDPIAAAMVGGWSMLKWR